jgi:hypothetical protein
MVAANSSFQRGCAKFVQTKELSGKVAGQVDMSFGMCGLRVGVVWIFWKPECREQTAGVLHSVQDDGVEQATARAKATAKTTAKYGDPSLRFRMTIFWGGLGRATAIRWEKGPDG